jgi:hypothetical protein
MRVIKLAILSFIFIFLLITLISLFIPGSIRISKATNIAADDRVVYTYVDELPDWKQWHPVLKNVPENEFVVLDDSNVKVQGTSIRVVGRKNEEIITEMVTDNGRPVISVLKVIRHQEGDSSTLQWYMDFKLRWYPWEKFKSLFFENIYGFQMERGLENLKQLSEGNRSSIN